MIMDIEKTISALVRCSELPMAVILIGIGDADFSQMVVLDGDDSALWSESLKKHVESDIV